MSAPPRVFASSSVISRRFPALRTLTSEDVEVMVVPPSPTSPKKATASGKPLLDPNVVKPSVVDSLGGAKGAAKPAAASSSKPRKERPPFRPANPSEAKETITSLRHGYVGIHSPYDLAHKLAEIERAEANRNIISEDVYMPTAWAQARKSIEINYFLNSPDAETIEAERRFIQEKAQRNMVEYYRRLRPSGPAQ